MDEQKEASTEGESDEVQAGGESSGEEGEAAKEEGEVSSEGDGSPA